MWMRDWYRFAELLAVTGHTKTMPINQKRNVTRVLTATPLKASVHARGLTQSIKMSSSSAAF